MSSRDEEWWDLQAGEFVLGTLDNHERELFESIRKRDPEFQRRVTAWQEHLSQLDQAIEPVQPPEHVLPSIESQLGFTATEADLSESILDKTFALERVQDVFNLEQLSDEYAATPERPGNSIPVINSIPHSVPVTTEADITAATTQSEAVAPPLATTRGNNIWRDLTMLATAACVILSFMLWNKHYVSSKTPAATIASVQQTQFDLISVVVNENSEPLWVVNAATAENLTQVIALSPPALNDDQSYQLWLVKPENTGVSSMGLLPAKAGEQQMLNAPLLDGEAVAFAVSLEPKGGSPAATPTGPVLFQGGLRRVSLTN